MAFLDETGLAELWSLIGGKYGVIFNHCWRRYDLLTNQYTLGSSLNTYICPWTGGGNPSQTLSYSDRVSVSNGTVSLGGTIRTKTVSSYVNVNELAGYFVLTTKGTVVKMAASPNTQAGDDGWYAYANKVIAAPDDIGDTYSMVYSTVENAYPDGELSGGYYYVYAGITLDNAAGGLKIAVGSYTGTGKFGSSNKNSLSFGFKPQLVIVQNTSSYYSFYAVNGASYAEAWYSSSAAYNEVISWSEDTISWYNGNSAGNQMNNSGTTYKYLAIG